MFPSFVCSSTAHAGLEALREGLRRNGTEKIGGMFALLLSAFLKRKEGR